MGYLWRQGAFHVHGFLSVDVPTDAVAPDRLFDAEALAWFNWGF